MINTDSAYDISLVVFGMSIHGRRSDYGVFLLVGKSKITGKDNLILAIAETDGKTFWPLSTGIEEMDSLSSDFYLSAGIPGISASLQMIDGELVISCFEETEDAGITEKSYRISIPVPTSIR